MLRARRILLSGAAALIVLTVASAAAAETITRDDYVAKLESICEPGMKQTQKAMKGARADVRKERNAAAARKFDRGTVTYAATLKKISAVPRPEADLAKLKEWFARLDRQTQYMREMAAKLRADQSIKAQRLLARFIHNGNQANNLTLSFEFDWCAFRYSRFG